MNNDTHVFRSTSSHVGTNFFPPPGRGWELVQSVLDHLNRELVHVWRRPTFIAEEDAAKVERLNFEMDVLVKAINDTSSTPASREYYSNRLNELQREKQWLTEEM